MERELGDADRAEIERRPSHDEAGQQCQHGFELPRSFREHAAKLGQARGSDDEKLGSFHFDCGGVTAKLESDVARQKRRTAENVVSKASFPPRLFGDDGSRHRQHGMV